MDILVVGGGGREHAIIKKLRENPRVNRIYALPGNGGISFDAECIPISATDLDGIFRFVSETPVDFAVIGPDDPLVMGLADRLSSLGIPTFGPSKRAAILEGSKAFAKEFMQKYRIPTASFSFFSDPKEALSHLQDHPQFPVVLKADGLALGKGVIIAETMAEAEEAIKTIMIDRKFGESGQKIVIEEYLSGPEVSVLAFTDSVTLVPMVSSMDHKRAYDNDQGPNTGGMGVIAPNPFYTKEIADRCMEEIFLPTIKAMNEEGRPFKGCLYFGLMLTSDGPKVIEYNCRFGDPETQAVLPLLSSDLLTIFEAVVAERLSELPITFQEGASCCVIAASGGYPDSYETGFPISGLVFGQLEDNPFGSIVYHAGTQQSMGSLLTKGGRVFGITSVAPTLAAAIDHTYQSLAGIRFQGMHYRKDIGKRALSKPVYRIYVEKKPPFAVEAMSLTQDLRLFLGIKELESVRVLNRYDVQGVDRFQFESSIPTILSEPQVDLVYEQFPEDSDAQFGVESLPGQFDQRADSCAQCIQIVTQEQKPTVRTAKVYLLKGSLSKGDLTAIKDYLINPVESREADLSPVSTLELTYEAPDRVEEMKGFLHYPKEQLASLAKELELAMDLEDLLFCQSYFQGERRDPTVTELRMIDTYWSDHCRHTTFSTVLDEIDVQDPMVKASFQRFLQLQSLCGRNEKPITLMELATIGARALSRQGLLPNLDVSEEINACSVQISVEVDGTPEPWLLMFKNETHNHPTEIEPFGGAATCIGGAIRDPLSGRSYVYQAMRITGAASPLADIKDTLHGKLPQRKIVTTAAAGYSSYGNQIGLATGFVEELYHPGYLAKRMELGAVLGAAPLSHVRRERPVAGDQVLLLGGKTGRDGCGGATGSSKSHTTASLEKSGAEVQKGNAPEERKIQRLFRNPAVTGLIKRCNDFGAGGVSVAVGELADGLSIHLDAMPKKYEGLNGTELAISESQERMAVVVAKEDVSSFLAYAEEENLEATVIAEVTGQDRMTMDWNGREIVNLSRSFLNSNGVPKHAKVAVSPYQKAVSPVAVIDWKERIRNLVSDLNHCSKKGLVERFDSTVGAATVLMPFGGVTQETPTQAMVAKLPVLHGKTKTCSVMAYGYNPTLTEKDPYTGSYLAVVESISKVIAAGASRKDAYLTFQEYFEKLGQDPSRWGKPFAALLGALDAQMDFAIGAIGGKDSMSGSFEALDVPPALVSFAVSVCSEDQVVSPEFKKVGSKLVWLSPAYGERGLPEKSSLLSCFETVEALAREGKLLSAYTPTKGAVAEGLFQMSLGNRIGIRLDPRFALEDLFQMRYGSFLLEVDPSRSIGDGQVIGTTLSDFVLEAEGERIDLDELKYLYDSTLEQVYPTKVPKNPNVTVPVISYDVKTKKGEVKKPAPAFRKRKPKAFIPVFPGTNCEYDTALALEEAGAEPEILVIKNLEKEGIVQSIEAMAKGIKSAQMIVLPGGFSGGDEPDGSGKFITAFFRNPKISDEVHALLKERDGLMCGICNGFQALIKLGLVPYGEIREMDKNSPTLTFNEIGRHQSRLVRTRIASNLSPWFMDFEVGDVHLLPISHGEGRFVAEESLIADLAAKGQIATQYVDLSGNPTMDIDHNPNGSLFAVEALTSPDGRVLGKMAHTERYREGLYRNVPGNKEQPIFRNAVRYYSI